MTETRRSLFILTSAVILYTLLIGPFTAYMKEKPIEEKLGYFPSQKILKYSSADHRELMGAYLVMKVIMYFGGVVEKQDPNVINQPTDFQGMSRMLHGAIHLDPYNLDAYYFAQSFLTWDVKQYQVANDLLDYGIKHRDWDWMLPFFAGFNSAYFLKDFAKAAEYYKRAGDLSGQDLHKRLAGRYMQEAGQTDLAIAYLTVMEKSEKNQAMKKTYQVRLQSFHEARRIELARDRFKKNRGLLPQSLEELQQSGYLSPAPLDPYGGVFYLRPDGSVATTSKFAFISKNQ